MPCVSRRQPGLYSKTAVSSGDGNSERMSSPTRNINSRGNLLERLRQGSLAMQRTGIRFLRGGGFEFVPPGSDVASASTGLGIDWHSAELVLSSDDNEEGEAPTDGDDDTEAGEDAFVWR